MYGQNFREFSEGRAFFPLLDIDIEHVGEAKKGPVLVVLEEMLDGREIWGQGWTSTR